MGGTALVDAASPHVREASSAPLRDADIRAPLHAWLAAEYLHDASTVIYDEFAIPRPASRVDLAVVNGSLIAYEIKSDVDSTARLQSQINSYGKIFDKVFLVTTPRCLQKFQNYIPDWWGIVTVDGQGCVKCSRKAKNNRTQNKENILHLLHRSELSEIALEINVALRSNCKKENIIKEIIASKAKHRTIHDLARIKLKERRAKNLLRQIQDHS